MSDPTYEAMQAFLMPLLKDEGDLHSVEEAIYWYAHDWQVMRSVKMQRSPNMQRAMTLARFKPGAYNTGLEDGSEALRLYTELVEEFS